MNITNITYKNRIFELLRKLGFATPETIRKEYMLEYDYISWATIKRHLELLYEEKRIEKKIVSKGKKRSIIIYLISKMSK